MHLRKLVLELLEARAVLHATPRHLAAAERTDEERRGGGEDRREEHKAKFRRRGPANPA